MQADNCFQIIICLDLYTIIMSQLQVCCHTIALTGNNYMPGSLYYKRTECEPSQYNSSREQRAEQRREQSAQVEIAS